MRDQTKLASQSSNRAFGAVFATVFVVVGLLPLLSGTPPWLWTLAPATLFALLAWRAPARLATLAGLWSRFGTLLHHVTAPILLGLMLFAVITPIGAFMRLLRTDPLRLRFDPSADSYWIVRTPAGPAADSLGDQF
jgi:hypothetical protein